MTKFEIFFCVLFLNGTVFAAPYVSCEQDPARQNLRSAELKKIVAQDQSDRSIPYKDIDWDKLNPRDEARRKRIGEIFGEGCMNTAADYSAAALVYQHGTIPDHYFQTFIWAKKAYELGDQNAKRLSALGIDRYLVHSGRKQLFATQAGQSKGSKCWCLNQVESTFPEAKRLEYTKDTIKAQLAWVDSMNDDPNCKPAKFCTDPVKDSPAGTVPGLW